MSTVVATNINTDALVGNTSANAITVRGEGSATTSLQQGIAKQWAQVKMNDTWALNDSFNVSSASDSGTGYSRMNFTSNFANVNYSATAAGDSSDWGHVVCIDGPVTTSHLWIYGLRSASQAAADNPRAQNTTHGDLA